MRKESLITNDDVKTLDMMETIIRHLDMNRKLDPFFGNPRWQVEYAERDNFTANFYDLIRRLKKVENIPLQRIS
jgi:hypothetical protein